MARSTEFDGESVVSFVLSANLHRRHLSPGQQAAIVSSAQDWAQAQTVGNPAITQKCNVAPLATAADRAAESGASLRTQKMADKVAKADPELAKQVAHGEISLPKAVQQIDPKPEKLQAYADEDHALQEAQDTIIQLSQEVEKLQDRIAVESMDASEEGKMMAAQTIEELRERVTTLERELAAVKQSRDTFQRENSELKSQVQMLMRQLKKAGNA